MCHALSTDTQTLKLILVYHPFHRVTRQTLRSAPLQAMITSLGQGCVGWQPFPALWLAGEGVSEQCV
jgi:hypothetical protein